MLHELLFVLLGYPGDVFQPHPTSNPSMAATTFAIPSNFPLLHPSERASLNRLGQLGWNFYRIDEAISQVRDTSSKISTRSRSSTNYGSYIQAFMTSVEKILNQYRSDVLELEKEILNDTLGAGANIIPLTLITANLNRWEMILPFLYKQLVHPILISTTTSVTMAEKDSMVSEYYGCRLFDLVLYHLKTTGVSEVRDVLQTIREDMDAVFHRQLTAWMVYGQLIDPHNEFFINRTYGISKKLLPQHIPLKLAESILFVGKAVAIVNHQYQQQQLECNVSSSRKRMEETIPEALQEKHLCLLSNLIVHRDQHAPSLDTSFRHTLQSIVGQIKKSTADWLFFKVLTGEHGLEHYFSSFRDIFLLQDGELASNFIEACCIWKERNIPPGDSTNGNSNNSSSNNSSSNTDTTAMKFRQQELNTILKKAATSAMSSSSTLDATELLSSSLLSNFRVLIDNDQLPFADLLLPNIPIHLTFQLSWPIDLFLTRHDIRVYSHLWTFLISIKGTQMTLNQLYQYLLRDNNTESNSQQAEDGYNERIVWRLRSLMLFWINTFWNHIQFNVISRHYYSLLEDLSTAFSSLSTSQSTTNAADQRLSQPSSATAHFDFEQLQTSHDAFLRHILRGCLLTSKECVQVMHSILQLCLRFAEYMKQIYREGEWRSRNKRRKTMGKKKKTAAEIINEWTRQLEDSEPVTWIKNVQKMEETLIDLTQKFFSLASSQPSDVKLSGQLDGLLLQLDYNKWFSKPSVLS